MDFRTDVVDRFGEIPKEGPDVREMVTFAEAVATEVGPLLREKGIDETKRSAELYAALRCCYLFGVANEAAGVMALAKAQGVAPDGEKLSSLADSFQSDPFDPLFYTAMRRYVGILTYFGQAQALNAMLRRVGPDADALGALNSRSSWEGQGLLDRLRRWCAARWL
jgi:hypothetical protein